MENSADILKEFLVSLGWKIDEKSQKRADGLIQATSAKAAELGRAIATTAGAFVAASATIVAAVTKIADGMEKLYFASRRTNASVENIQSLGFAAGQMGSTAEAAQASLENLARFMRTNPGGEGLLRSLGIQTQDTNGQLRDTSDILQDLGKRFAQMPYYRANAYAQTFGIDEKTLMALRQGVGEFGGEYRRMLRAAGLDSQQAAKSSHEFMNQVRLLGAALGIVGKKAGTSFTDQLSLYTKRLRDFIVGNFPLIQRVIGRITEGILFASDLVFRGGKRIVDAVRDVITWFEKLPVSSKHVVEALGLIGAAWLALNSEFLMSPLGMIIALGTALLLLYDDYKTWKEGGKSLIDWSQWEPDIQAALHGINDLIAGLGELAKAFQIKFTFDKGDLKQFLDDIKDIVGILKALKDRNWSEAWRLFKKGERPGPTEHAWGNDTARNLGEKAGKNVAGLFSALEKKFHLPKGILDRMYSVESARGTQLNSAAGAKGPFQLMDGTAKDLGVSNPYDLQQSATAAAKYLHDLIAHFGGDVTKALAAYNWGEGNVDRKGLGHLPKETQDYLEKFKPELSGAARTMTLNPYSREQLARAATGSNTPPDTATPVIHQTNTITVTGASDPKATGQAVARAQSSVNERLIRNMKAVAY